MAHGIRANRGSIDGRIKTLFIPVVDGITEWRDNLSRNYAISGQGPKDGKDCVKKIKYLCSNPEEAVKVRKAGRKRVLREHIWGKWFEKV